MLDWLPGGMRKFLKSIYPPTIKRKYDVKKGIISDYIYDYSRFVKHSAYKGLKNKDNMRAFILKEYHAIEKGLTLVAVRPGFGVSRVIKLVGVLLNYIPKYGRDIVTEGAIACLHEYQKFEKANNDVTTPAVDAVQKLLSLYPPTTDKLEGGVRPVTKQEILESISFDFNKFFKSRYSTREFSDVPVSIDTVLEAVDLARFTPSVCNRQSWKVFIVNRTDNELLQRLLKVQNGNRGFTEQIDTLLVVTSKLSAFFARERNQAFIDGGMFAMSLITALHAKGLGACCLNTSYSALEDQAFKKAVKLDDDCVPIMFIAVGNLKDQYNVAISARKSLSDVAQVLNNPK